MMVGWELAPLDSLLRLERRPITVETDRAYQEIGIYCFGRGIFHKEPRSGLEIGDKSLFLLKEGDFILQVTFAWEGAIAIVGPEEDGMCGSTRYPTFRVDEERISPRFLLNFFRTERGREQLVKICPGSAGRNRVLNLKRLGEVKVPVPPLVTQRRIVEGIETLTRLIERAQSLRREAAEAVAGMWSSGAARVLRRAAEKYESRPLGSLVEVRGGGTPSKHNPDYWEGAIPWITPKDMKRRELSDAIDHISERATRETAARVVQPGAVLVVVRGMILAHTFPSAVLRARAAINQDMKALLPVPAVLPEYLNTFFWAFNADIVSRVEKSTHDTRKLETEKLLATPIIVPPLAKQREIVSELDALRAQIDTLSQLQAETRIEIDAQTPSAIEKAFQGKLWH